MDHTLTIEEFGRRLRAREVTAEQVTEACLRRIDEDNPRLNAFILVMADAARQQAREADRELAAGRDRGPLHGVPISIKDLIDIAGTPTTAASRVREGHVARHDAPVIVALREAGAVLIGKTNLHEFAFGTTNEESAFGPARNPHDPTRSPGGSSGGSAASVAAGMALATIGTDTGGSIRIPAAACGIVGLKPRLRRGFHRGRRAALANAGSRRTARANRGRCVAGVSRAPRRPGGIAAEIAGAEAGQHAAARGAEGLFLRPAGRRGARALRRSPRSASRGGRPRRRRHDPPREPHTDRVSPPRARRRRRLPRGDTRAMPERYTPPVRMRLEMGRYVLAEDYVRALEGREILRREVDSALAVHDALVLPALPIPAPPIGVPSVQVGGTDRAGPQPHASADAALQPDRPPRRRVARRANRERVAVLGSARRRGN